MYRDAIFHKGRYLAPNSTAYRLYKEGKLKECNAVMDETAAREAELLSRYSDAVKPTEVHTEPTSEPATLPGGLRDYQVDAVARLKTMLSQPCGVRFIPQHESHRKLTDVAGGNPSADTDIPPTTLDRAAGIADGIIHTVVTGRVSSKEANPSAKPSSWPVAPTVLRFSDLSPELQRKISTAAGQRLVDAVDLTADELGWLADEPLANGAGPDTVDKSLNRARDAATFATRFGADASALVIPMGAGYPFTMIESYYRAGDKTLFIDLESRSLGLPHLDVPGCPICEAQAAIHKSDLMVAARRGKCSIFLTMLEYIDFDLRRDMYSQVEGWPNGVVEAEAERQSEKVRSNPKTKRERLRAATDKPKTRPASKLLRGLVAGAVNASGETR